LINQPLEVTAGKLLKGRAGQSPTSTRGRTTSLHEWRLISSL